MHLLGHEGQLAVAGYGLAKEGLQGGGHRAHCQRRADLAAKVAGAPVAVRDHRHRHSSLRARSHGALHRVLVGKSGAPMRTATYAGMRYFPAHRFTSARSSSLLSRLAPAGNHYQVESSSDGGATPGTATG